eukprot:6171653-Amphidinium_carterae.1
MVPTKCDGPAEQCYGVATCLFSLRKPGINQPRVKTRKQSEHATRRTFVPDALTWKSKLIPPAYSSESIMHDFAVQLHALSAPHPNAN